MVNNHPALDIYSGTNSLLESMIINGDNLQQYYFKKMWGKLDVKQEKKSQSVAL